MEDADFHSAPGLTVGALPWNGLRSSWDMASWIGEVCVFVTISLLGRLITIGFFNGVVFGFCSFGDSISNILISLPFDVCWDILSSCFESALSFSSETKIQYVSSYFNIVILNKVNNVSDHGTNTIVLCPYAVTGFGACDMTFQCI